MSSHTTLAPSLDRRPVGDLARLRAGLLGDIAQGIATAEDLWRDHAHHDPQARRPVRLVAADRWEAWVIGWTSGQRVELHDHGRSAGALVVVEGELVDVRWQSGRLVHHRRPRGSVTVLPVGVVHDVLARGPGPTTSIHVYGPALETMTFYAPDGRPFRTDPVPDEPPVSDLRGGARALPPSVHRG